MSSEDFSALEKKHCDMFSEGKAANPVRCDSPLQKVMAAGALFLKTELARLGVAACCCL